MKYILVILLLLSGCARYSTCDYTYRPPLSDAVNESIADGFGDTLR